MNKATVLLNDRCLFASRRRAFGASFANIAEVLGVSKDKARTMVGRGNRLRRDALAKDVVDSARATATRIRKAYRGEDSSIPDERRLVNAVDAYEATL